MFLLFLLLLTGVRSFDNSSLSPYIIVDGCPERNHKYNPETGKRCSWDLAMCPGYNTNSTPRPTPTPTPSRPAGPSTGPSRKPTLKPTQFPTYITAVIHKVTAAPTISSAPSKEPTSNPSDVPSDYPTWISTSKVRCPNATKLVNATRTRRLLQVPSWCAHYCHTFKYGTCHLVYPQCYPM